MQDPTKFDVLVMPNLYGDILRYIHEQDSKLTLTGISTLLIFSQ